MSVRAVEVVWDLSEFGLMNNISWYSEMTNELELPQFVSIPDNVCDDDIVHHLNDKFGHYVYKLYFVE
ncbi:MAG: hypothetical protein VX036_03890 [Pseudomonadota bacterium]|nr:hypothetical protein [Pseudomonadota bacterium]